MRFVGLCKALYTLPYVPSPTWSRISYSSRSFLYDNAFTKSELWNLTSATEETQLSESLKTERAPVKFNRFFEGSRRIRGLGGLMRLSPSKKEVDSLALWGRRALPSS